LKRVYFLTIVYCPMFGFFVILKKNEFK